LVLIFQFNITRVSYIIVYFMMGVKIKIGNEEKMKKNYNFRERISGLINYWDIGAVNKYGKSICLRAFYAFL